MNKSALVLASFLAAASLPAFAEDDPSTYNPDIARQQAREIRENGYGWPERRYGDERRYYEERRYRDSRETRRECWNPRARHFENVREGEFQDDLDYRRCRVVSTDDRRWR